MRYLGLALFGEGITDYKFLTNVIRRTAEDVCAKRVKSPVEIGDVVALRTPVEAIDDPLASKILRSAQNAAGSFDILCIHTDGAGNWEKARDERVHPAAELVGQEESLKPAQTVAIIPVREMEAWVLADGATLRQAFATTLPDEELGIPARPRDVETIYDPKLTLEAAFEKTLPGRRRSRKTSVESYLDTIGEQIDLDKLRGVPSFRRFEEELSLALQHLGFLV